MNDSVANLVLLINEANAAYRTGNAIITDADYDALIDELEERDPNHPILNKVGLEVMDETRKELIPIPMASMNKCKTTEAIRKWMVSKGISEDTEFVASGKYDGLSLAERQPLGRAWTRGDGTYGQRSDEHLKLMPNAEILMPHIHPFKHFYTFGEVIMKRSTFLNKYADQYENPRNLVAGILNKKEANEVADKIADLDFLRYGMVPLDNKESKEFFTNFTTKSQIFGYLNQYQQNKVQWRVLSLNELNEEYLKELFKEWNQEYELDGIIIEVNDMTLQQKLGRETSSNNPCYARAYKGSFEEQGESPYVGDIWKVSKQGYLKPVYEIEPIRLDGVTVTFVTGNNAKYVRDNRIGKGSILKIVRSGMVIPLIKGVINPVTEAILPTCCPSCGSTDLQWNDTQVELMCVNIDCEGQQLQRMISFFSTLGVENVGEGVCSQLFDAGFNTVRKVLAMTQADMEKLEGFGKRKAEITYKAIHSKMKDVSLAKLQHATGSFKNLGSKKLALLEHFETRPSYGDIIAIDGFSDISAHNYLNGLDSYAKFIEGLPITVKRTEKVAATSDEFKDQSFCFTGVRDKEAEAVIESKGGKIASGVSKTLTYLVVKEKGSGSSKEVKAQSLGVKVISLEDLKSIL